MANMTLAIPDELQRKLRKHTEIRWSEVVRLALEKKVADLEMMDRLTNRSRLTKKDADEIAEIVDSEVARKLGLK
jgi:hypothetical protein